MTDLTLMTWRKSSASQGNGQCVEVARWTAGLAVRDSKSPRTGHLMVNERSAAAFVTAIKAGRLDG